MTFQNCHLSRSYYNVIGDKNPRAKLLVNHVASSSICQHTFCDVLAPQGFYPLTGAHLTISGH